MWRMVSNHLIPTVVVLAGEYSPSIQQLGWNASIEWDYTARGGWSDTRTAGAALPPSQVSRFAGLGTIDGVIVSNCSRQSLNSQPAVHSSEDDAQRLRWDACPNSALLWVGPRFAGFDSVSF